MPALYFQTNCQVKGAQSYEKRKSEKSGLQLGYYQFKFLGLHLGLETFTNLLFYLAYVFQNITSFTGRSYLNLALFAIALQESLSVHFVNFKICKLSGVLAVVWLLPDQICSVYIQVERLSKNPFTPALRMFSLFCV